MARLLEGALGHAGFEPTLASELRTLDKEGDPDRQERLEAESEAVAADLIRSYGTLAPARRPRLWFTYHVYYKAPDWIGPRVADALRIPYVIAEGSRAPKRITGPWALGNRSAEAALDRADLILVMTDRDRPALERCRPRAQILVDLPPFVEDDWVEASSGASRGLPGPDGPELLTVAMMRRGDKFESYRILGASLRDLADCPWILHVAGDGEAREEIQRLLKPVSSRVRFHGEVGDRAVLRTLYDKAHLFVWPAVNEAYGMALLEAQARGCPVVAGAFGGVASVVRHGQTGYLTTPGDTKAFADAIRTLLRDTPALRRMGSAARRFVSDERTLAHASYRLRSTLMPLIEGARR